MAVRYSNPHRSNPPNPGKDAGALFAQAIQAHGAGQTAFALGLYEKLLAQGVAQTKVLELAGIACMQLGRYPAALAYLRKCQEEDPRNIHVLNNLGVILKNLGEYEEAAGTLRAALQLGPGSADTLNNLGAALEGLQDINAAVQAYLRAVSLEPEDGPALGNLRRLLAVPAAAMSLKAVLESRKNHLSLRERELLALSRNVLAERDAGAGAESLALLLRSARDRTQHGDTQAAIELYRKVLAQYPDHAMAWNDLGFLLRQVRDYAQALTAFRKAAELEPDSALVWNNLGSCHLDLGDAQQARAALEQAERLAPDLANVQCNLGMLLRSEHAVVEAMARYRRAIELDPDLFEAHVNLGNLCSEFGDDTSARAAFKRATEIAPQNAEAAMSVGLATSDPGVAATHFDRALALRPHYAQAEVARVYNQLKGCDWTDLSRRLAQVGEMVLDAAMPPISPFWMLALSDSRRTQLACARKWVSAKVMPGLAPLRAAVPQQHHTRGQVPRIGLLSGDLREHAVGELLRDALPRIDRRACELYAYDASPDDGSATRRALLASCKVARPIHTLGIHALAAQICTDGIDVLVDLSGFTQHSRTMVLGLRPAPVQVSYLGFPGSMGWDAVDWLLADDHLVPALHEADYDERVARLPHCYQPGRHFALVGDTRPTRAAVGLPEDAMVFACFGNAYKLRPDLFECWLRLLKRTPRSVLWFARFNETAEHNLRNYARHHGVDPARLVFAPVVPLDQHSARLPLADLFLDTAPYGSGMTAAQTLHAGVPLITIAGNTYVGRMASSLLHAMGLDTLIAGDLDDYEGRALRLAQDSDARRRLRQQIEALRERTLNPQRSAQDLERTFVRLAESTSGAAQRYLHTQRQEESVT